MDLFVDKNRRAYDHVAEEYERKLALHKTTNAQLLAGIKSVIPESGTILEIGPAGACIANNLLRQGYHVVGIDFSEKMAAVAKRNAPGIEMIVDDFLTHEFTETFDGILALAFIHLFPSTHTSLVLNKIHTLLAKGAPAYITTTCHKHASEGVEEKQEYETRVMRYRRRFTREEFEKSLSAAGFVVQHVCDIVDNETPQRTWMNYAAWKR